jgi:hypothetical protein
MIKSYRLTQLSLAHLCGQLAGMCREGEEFEINAKPWKDKRSLASNKKMWACLGDVAKQVKWPVNGRLQLISTDDWKDIISSGLKQEARIAEGIGGGFVMLGQRTSKMTIAQMSEMIELIYAFGAGYGVVWSEPIPAEYLEFSEANK